MSRARASEPGLAALQRDGFDLAAAEDDTTFAGWLAHRDQIRASRVRLGTVGYAYLAAMLRDEPCTVVRLQRRAQLGHVAAYRFVMTMHSLGRLRVCGWQEAPRAPLQPLFAFGPGADVPPPARRQNGRPVQAVALPKPRTCAAVIAFEMLLRTIEVPASRAEIEAATGLDGSTVAAAVQALVDVRLAHVPLWLWRRQGGAPLPQYQLGEGRNVPPPRPRRAERRAILRTRAARRRSFEPLAQAMRAAFSVREQA
jgi:hypothetical protein